MENSVTTDILEEMIADHEDNYARLFAAGEAPKRLHTIWVDIQALRQSLSMVQSEKNNSIAGSSRDYALTEADSTAVRM